MAKGNASISGRAFGDGTYFAIDRWKRGSPGCRLWVDLRQKGGRDVDRAGRDDVICQIDLSDCGLIGCLQGGHGCGDGTDVSYAGHLAGPMAKGDPGLASMGARAIAKRCPMMGNVLNGRRILGARPGADVGRAGGGYAEQVHRSRIFHRAVFCAHEGMSPWANGAIDGRVKGRAA